MVSQSDTSHDQRMSMFQTASWKKGGRKGREKERKGERERERKKISLLTSFSHNNFKVVNTFLITKRKEKKKISEINVLVPHDCEKKVFEIKSNQILAETALSARCLVSLLEYNTKNKCLTCCAFLQPAVLVFWLFLFPQPSDNYHSHYFSPGVIALVFNKVKWFYFISLMSVLISFYTEICFSYLSRISSPSKISLISAIS